jgi:multicomponent Na+:H+ antiporter subunit C
MSHPEVWIVTASLLFGLGLYGLLVGGHPLRQLLSIKIMGSALFLLLVVGGGSPGGLLDGIPLALVLTGIVVAISAIAFALTLLVRLAEVTGSLSLEAPEGDGEGDGDDEGGAGDAR